MRTLLLMAKFPTITLKSSDFLVRSYGLYCTFLNRRVSPEYLDKSINSFYFTMDGQLNFEKNEYNYKLATDGIYYVIYSAGAGTTPGVCAISGTGGTASVTAGNPVYISNGSPSSGG